MTKQELDLIFVICAESGTRTRTPFAGHRILSPVRLPIPPSRQNQCKRKKIALYKNFYLLTFSFLLRRRTDSNRCIKVLQTSPLPLGYGAKHIFKVQFDNLIFNKIRITKSLRIKTPLTGGINGSGANS
jgi:hypothetical protein